MRYFLLLTVIILASAQIGRSQCAPNNPTGNFGFFPATDLLACVDRGVFYDQTFYLENIDSFVFSGFGSIRVDTLRIDSIVNLPCNLNWISDRGGNTYGLGETGCIRVYGVTNDTTGQYRLKIYVTIVASLIGRLQGDINQIIEDLENLSNTNLGVDFEYFVRVKETADPCPAIDRNANSPLERTAQANCSVPGFLTAQITGDTSICIGTNGQLSLNLSNVINPAIEWLPNSAVASPNTTSTGYNLTTSGYITAQVTDTAGTGNIAFDRVWVKIDTSLPAALFTNIVNGRSIRLQANNTNGTYSWSLGDQSIATGPIVLHTYAADGLYPIALTVSNNCGTDMYYDTIRIGTVGIGTLSPPAVQFSLYPNPAQGSVTLSVNNMKGVEDYSIHVTDLSGKQVLQPRTVHYQPNAVVEVSVAGLPAGIYIFQIKTLHSSSFNKLVIY